MSSRIAVEFGGEDYGIVLHTEGEFVDLVKELTVQKLKSLYPRTFSDQSLDIRDLLLFIDPERFLKITEEEMPTGKRFYAKIVQEEGKLKKLLEDIPEPSSFSKHKDKHGWTSILNKHKNAVVCHRMPQEEFALPVDLLSRVFSNFCSEYALIDIAQDDCDFMTSLTLKMCTSFRTEKERIDAFIPCFRNIQIWSC
jgi:hypothetical protein